MTTPRLTLTLNNGSVSFPFPLTAAQSLQTMLTTLVNQLKANVSKTGTALKTEPQPPMEYQYTGDVFLEVYCNPNIWASPFAAKVLITLRDDRINLSTEAELSRLIDDINQVLD